jgi:hypothetical protein
MSCGCNSGYDGGIYGGVCNADTPYPSVSSESVPSLIDNLVYALYGAIQKDVTSGKVVWDIPCDPVTAPATIFDLPRNEGEGLLCYFIRALNAANDGGSTFYGSFVGGLTGNATTATALQTARNFSLTGAAVASPVSFNGSNNVVLNTSISNLPDSSLATISTAGKVSNSATSATSANTANTIVLRNASGGFSTGAITGSLIGNATSATNLAGGLLNSIPYQTAANTTSFLPVGTNGQVVGVLSGVLTWVNAPAAVTSSAIAGGAAGQVHWQSGSNTTGFTATGTAGQVLTSNGTSVPTWSTNIGGNSATATTLQTARTIAISGDVTGTATSFNGSANISIPVTINAGAIVNDDINATAGIVDTKLATISTSGKVSNSATTATNANTANAIVARDASGNFTAGTITANVTGNGNSTFAGNVGIGTSSPSAKVEVVGATLGASSGNISEIARFSASNANQGILRVYQNRFANGNSWVTAETRIQQRTDTTDQAYISFNPSGSGDIGFGTTSLERLRIAANGTISTQSNPITNCPTTAKAWVNFNGTIGNTAPVAIATTETFSCVAGGNILTWRRTTASFTNNTTQSFAFVILGSSTFGGANVSNMQVAANYTSSTFITLTLPAGQTFSSTITNQSASTTSTFRLLGRINSSHNVSSITKLGVGAYEIGFVNTITNPAMAGSAKFDSSNGGEVVNVVQMRRTTGNGIGAVSSIRIATGWQNGSTYVPFDEEIVGVIVFGN